ncbi:MAG TPA: hypothetical protein VGL98_10640 [Gammaproteobacteria bacterium]
MSILSAGAAFAQPSSPASFCEAAGAYMQEISVQRAAGAQLDAAIAEVAVAFDAFASDAADLANRRRVLQAGRPPAVFVYNLGDLRPETVKEIGTAYCLARDGDITLAPSPTTTAAISAEAGQCEQRAEGGSVEASCVAKAVGAEAKSTTATAQTTERPARRSRTGSRIQPFWEAGLAYGGDTIGSILFVSGDEQDIKAGDGFSFGGGIVQRINDRLGIKYTAAYKVSFSSASNADVMKTVLPIDIIPYYRTGDHKFGVGLSLHLSPEVDWDWLAPTMDFDDATGITLEYAFRKFGFSYTDMDYEWGPLTYDASHLSFKFTSKF